MKTFMIINGSPRKDGISAELVKQVKPYFLDCEIKEYNIYDLAPAPCTDCKYCEYHEGCSNHDLDIFFEDFEAADYVAFFTPVYNNFFPAPLKAVIDRFQRYLTPAINAAQIRLSKSAKRWALLSRRAPMRELPPIL